MGDDGSVITAMLVSTQGRDAFVATDLRKEAWYLNREIGKHQDG